MAETEGSISMRIASILFLVTAPITAAVAQTPQSAPTGTDLLVVAIEHGDLKSMEALLSAGLDPNRPSRGGQTPLYYAIVVVNRLSAVSLLLNWHADPNKP